MILEKIHSGSNENRNVGVNEVLSKYIFDGVYPRKFISGIFYKAGDFRYTVNNDGTINIYQCINSGTYENIDLINWRLTSLECTIEDIVSRLVGVSTSKVDTSLKFDYDVYLTRDLSIGGKRIMLPEKVTEYTELIIFLDGKYISKDMGDYTVTYTSHTKCVDVSIDFDDVIIYTMTPLNHNAKLISHTDIHPSSITEDNGNVMLYVPIEATMNGYSFNVFINGKFIVPASYQYYFDDESSNIVIIFPEGVVTDRKSVVISLISSRSKNISIESFDINATVTNSIEAYRIDINDAFKYYKDTPIAFKDGYAIPYNILNIDDNVLSVTKQEYYGQVGDYFDIISYEYKYTGQNIDSLSAYIMLDVNERIIPIPIVDYSSVVDFLLFYKSGTYISKKRFYTKDGYLHLYDHEQSLSPGDLVMFEGLDNDPTVSIRSYIGEVDIEKSLYIPSNVTSYTYMIFTSTGVYIGKQFYNVENNVLRFTDDANIKSGDAIEIVYISYNEYYTNTICKLASTKMNTSGELLVPLSNFDVTTDKLIVFNSDTGVYIDSSKYVVGPNGVIEITLGSGFTQEENMDVMVIRNIKKSIYTSSVNYVLDII